MRLDARFCSGELMELEQRERETVECMTCGAAVVCPRTHNLWHEVQEELLEKVVAKL